MDRLAEILNSPYGKSAVAMTAVVDEIIEQIQGYESDTFNPAEPVSQAEAMMILALLIKSRIAPGDNLDGVTLTELLEEVRGNA